MAKKEIYNFGTHGGDLRDKKPKSWEEDYNSWKETGSFDSYNNLVTQMDPVVDKALTSFAGGDPSMRNKAKVLTSQAIKTYDPNKGADLKTHVYNNLKRLNRIQAERSRVVHVPENVRVDAQTIVNFKRKYQDKQGFEPSLEVIQDNVGLSRKRIQKALHMHQQSESESLTEKGQSTVTVKDPDDIWLDYVYHDLDETDKKIFEWTTGRYGHDVLRKGEIARRLKISGPAVSKRVNKIMGKINEGSTLDV